MTSREEAKLSMYDAVIACCDANAAIVATIPAFATALTALKADVVNLKTAMQGEADVISGITVDKGEQKKLLSDMAASVAYAVFAYASETNNSILKAQVNFTPSDILRLRDEEVSSTCQNIHAAATANLAALADYGINAATLTLLDATITNYETKVPGPRNATITRAAYRLAIDAAMKEADEVLKNRMDKLSVQFKAANINFYNEYKGNRIIVDAPTSTTKLVGGVIEYATEVAISGALVEVVGQSYTATTDGSGSFEITIPVPGTYSVTVSKAGYNPNTLNNVEITLGQTTTLQVELVPDGE